MICSSCRTEITANPRRDNRYRACSICKWAMHHGCWIEHLTDGTLPCPYVKDGLLEDEHCDVMGLHGQDEWLAMNE